MIPYNDTDTIDLYGLSVNDMIFLFRVNIDHRTFLKIIQGMLKYNMYK